MEHGDARDNLQRNSDHAINDDTQTDFHVQSVVDLGANFDAINANNMMENVMVASNFQRMSFNDYDGDINIFYDDFSNNSQMGYEFNDNAQQHREG